MARYDDLNTGAIAYATFAGSVLFLLIVLLVRALCYSWLEGEDVAKLATSHYAQADADISEQKSRISGYSKEMVPVASPDAGDSPEGEAAEPKMAEVIHIPISQAKEVLLKELSSSGKSDTDA